MIAHRNRRRFAGGLSVFLLMGFAVNALAQVERYKDEGLYLSRLVELGYATVREDFEDTIWDPLHSIYPATPSATSLTHRRIRWQSAGRDLWTYPGTPALIGVNQNWARGAGWGIYDNYLASTLRVVTPEPIHGIGFWVKTNPGGQDVGVLFTDRTTANAPGYLLPGFGVMYPGDIHPFGHDFVGFIDPTGFTNVIITGTLEVNEENQLEGGTVYGVDDVTFAVPSGFILGPYATWRADRFRPADLNDPSQEDTLWGDSADPDLDSVDNWHEYLFGGDPNVADALRTAVIPALASDPVATHRQFSFRRRTDDPRLTYVPEATPDATTWLSGSLDVVDVEVTPIDRSLEHVTCNIVGSVPSSEVTLGRVAVLVAP